MQMFDTVVKRTTDDTFRITEATMVLVREQMSGVTSELSSALQPLLTAFNQVASEVGLSTQRATEIAKVLRIRQPFLFQNQRIA